MNQVLKSRRIEGLLLCRLSSDLIPEEFPWDDYFAVSMVRSMTPAFHLVANDQFQSATLAVQRLHELGYQRIGMVMHREFAHHTEFHFLGGFSSECARRSIPLRYRLDHSSDELEFQQNNLRWIHDQKLDAVIASGPGDLFPTLDEDKAQFLRNLSVVFLSRFKHYPQVHSIEQNNRRIGSTAANQLIDLMRRNERGIPEFPIRLLIKGEWFGSTSILASPQAKGLES